MAWTCIARYLDPKAHYTAFRHSPIRAHIDDCTMSEVRLLAALRLQAQLLNPVPRSNL